MQKFNKCLKEDEKGCRIVYERNSQKLIVTNGELYCGVVGKYSPLNATRVDLETKECPQGFRACSKNTSPYNTICYDPKIDKFEEVCPILGL